MSITWRGAFGCGESRRVGCRQRGLTMSETKCALYFGAVFSTLFRVFTYIFLRLVGLPRGLPSVLTLLTMAAFRPPSDGVNTCFPASIALTSQPFPSHLVAPNNRRLPLHNLQRKTTRPRLRLKTR